VKEGRLRDSLAPPHKDLPVASRGQQSSRRRRIAIPLAPILAGALPCHGARLQPPARGSPGRGRGLDGRLAAGAAPTTVHGNLGAPPAPPAVAASTY
jgi:hypothetical protein